MAIDDLHGHIVLCGLENLGYRTLEELRRLGERVVVVARSGSGAFGEDARGLGADLVERNKREERVLVAAGVRSASAVVLTEDDDVGNLHTALAAQELNPGVAIVLRMFNHEFGAKVQRLVPNCRVLDSSAIAAPSYVAAALHRDWDRRIEVGGRSLVARRGGRGAQDLLPLARLEGERLVELLPEGGGELLYLVDDGPSARSGAESAVEGDLGTELRRRRRHHLPHGAASVWGLLRSDRRLAGLALFLGSLLILSEAIFIRFAGLSAVDALYFTVTVMTTTGFGDINLRGAPAPLKLYGVALMLFGAASLAVLYALILDALVSARLARRFGGAPRHMHDHVVVCGLGNVGYRVVEDLVELGEPVAAAEMNEDGRFLPAVRALDVPVVVADTRLSETLEALRVAHARSIVVVTDDDLANLETALNALALNPTLRVVIRLFDADLAKRVERSFEIPTSRSVSELAAPAFAAAALGQRVIASIPVRESDVLFVAQATVEPGSQAVGWSIGAVERPGECRVLMLVAGGQRLWRPSRKVLLVSGQELVVVATRAGLTHILAVTEGESSHDRPRALRLPPA